ncbi:hypothetical protein SLEP1_g46954 [Rubroshorea leprosula]|uniref:F-box domain-containing protein n=1 Tax=Rubroshorea leprosula TaxID=152421 RepID=A0AAV5LNX4_9ROSI|nr:hypothetical protein SLEP1_g46954 [Rubroshorea leprosula]
MEEITTSSVHDQLPFHLVASIFKQLPLIHLLRAKTVSSSWNFVAEVVIPFEQDDEQGSPSCSGRVDSCDSSHNALTKPTSDVRSKFPCIGSSRGWHHRSLLSTGKRHRSLLNTRNHHRRRARDPKCQTRK